MDSIDIDKVRDQADLQRRGRRSGRMLRAIIKLFFVLLGLAVFIVALWRGTWWALLAWVFTAIFLIDSFLNVLFGMYEEPAARSLGFLFWISSVFMGRKAVQIITPDGRVRTVQPAEPLASLFARYGAPGIVIIESGAAVVFERSGRVSQVKGPGVAFTQRYERVAQVIDLRPQRRSKAVRKIMSRDGLSFDLGRLDVFYSVASHFDPRNGVYVVPEESVLDVVYRGGLLYEEGQQIELGQRVVREVERVVRNVAAEFSLSELIRLEDVGDAERIPASARSRFLEDVTSRAEPELQQIGIQLTRVDMGQVVIPGELRDLLALPLRQVVDLGLAHTQRDAIVGIAEGLKQAVHKFESSVPEEAKEALPHLLLNLTDSLRQLSDRFMGLARPYREEAEGRLLPAAREGEEAGKPREEGPAGTEGGG